MRTKNLLIAIGIFIVFNSLIFLLYYPSSEGLGKTFRVAMLYIITRNVVLFVGTGLLIFRLIGILRSNTGIFYILIAILNTGIGLLAVILYFMNEAIMSWVNKCLLNLLVGFFMVADTFILYKQQSK